MNLLTPIFIAVAMVSVPLFIAWFYNRKLQVEQFCFKCETLLNHSVINNESLSDPLKVQLLEAYQDCKKSKLELLFSTKPLTLNNWFSQEQQDAFLTVFTTAKIQ